MGVYICTLRKKTFTINGKNTAQYMFAYKPHWRDDENPVLARKHAAAERAKEAMRGVRQIVVGDVAKGFKCAVYEIDCDPRSCSYDDFGWGRYVGSVEKVGRKLFFTRKEDEAN